MQKKMFFLDLDGTTLKDDKTIPPENIAAIKEAVDRGHYVAIATGRAIASARPLVRALGMQRKGCFLISYNGALIYELEGETILRDLKLPDEYAHYLFSEAKKRDLYIQAYSDQYILAPYECPQLQYYAGLTTMEYRVVDDLFERMCYDTPKVLLVSVTGQETLLDFQREHMEWERGRCVSFFSCPEYLEYCPKLGTKAQGVAFMEEYLHLDHDNTIAIGDEENDLSMIRFAGVGAVMKNAREPVRKYADYITENDNNHAGVAEVIYKFIR